MAFHAANHSQAAAPRRRFARGMARPVLARSLGLSVGRKGTREGLRGA